MLLCLCVRLCVLARPGRPLALLGLFSPQIYPTPDTASCICAPQLNAHRIINDNEITSRPGHYFQSFTSSQRFCSIASSFNVIIFLLRYSLHGAKRKFTQNAKNKAAPESHHHHRHQQLQTSGMTPSSSSTNAQNAPRASPPWTSRVGPPTGR